MGVPALFKWLHNKYPKITQRVIEDYTLLEQLDALTLQQNDTKEELMNYKLQVEGPNQNGIEFDNLYLDMNGIVHPCTHPEDKRAPETEEEAMIEIFKYLDRILLMIRPRKVLYMAIDGVAPRAKMNQQRSRRFRAAQESFEKNEIEKEIRENSLNSEKQEEEKKEVFDSNCITPGTPFMKFLSDSLKYYIAIRLSNNPGFKDLKIILSDASVPGEGEHKIMDFIRHQRITPRHDPNTQHVLYGLDADLIMLGLATHEPNFYILREDVLLRQKNLFCQSCMKEGHLSRDCPLFDPNASLNYKPFVLLHLSILREYLSYELKVPGLPFEFDLERALDDWVFMCFFVGNDFLPHLPSLEIREGAIDQLVEIYKRQLPKFGGYLTENGKVELERVQIILDELGRVEEQVFQKRKEGEEKRKFYMQQKQQQQQPENEVEAGTTALPSGRTQLDPLQFLVPVNQKNMVHKSNKEFVDKLRTKNMNAAALLKANLLNKKSKEKDQLADSKEEVDKKEADKVTEETLDDKEITNQVTENTAKVEVEDEKNHKEIDNINDETDKKDETGKKRERPSDMAPEQPEEKKEKIENDDEEETEIIKEIIEKSLEEVDDDIEADDTPIDLPIKKVEKEIIVEQTDPVRLWESGWKERYYRSKFQVDIKDLQFRRKLVHAYCEGLCWVLAYYYQGCPSWKWFYPYHYSPFASDFGLTLLDEELNVQFEKGEPFKPLEQLMGVLPANSRKHIPKQFHPLMTDEQSEIIDFYPESFEIDLNGKKYAWQGVAILPFIDEKRLLEAMEKIYPDLDHESRQLNQRGNDFLFVGKENKLFPSLLALSEKEDGKMQNLDTNKSFRLSGRIAKDPNGIRPGSILKSPLTVVGLPDLTKVQCIDVIYENPKLPRPNYEFPACLLPGAYIPPQRVSFEDFIEAKNQRNRWQQQQQGRQREQTNQYVTKQEYTFQSALYQKQQEHDRKNAQQSPRQQRSQKQQQQQQQRPSQNQIQINQQPQQPLGMTTQNFMPVPLMPTAQPYFPNPFAPPMPALYQNPFAPPVPPPMMQMNYGFAPPAMPPQSQPPQQERPPVNMAWQRNLNKNKKK